MCLLKQQRCKSLLCVGVGAMKYCSCLLRSCMATLINQWESSREKSAKNQPKLLATTCRVIELMRKVIIYTAYFWYSSWPSHETAANAWDVDFCDRWSSGVSVCLSVTCLWSAKMAVWIEVFLETLGGPRNIVLDVSVTRGRRGDSMWPLPNYFGHLLEVCKLNFVIVL